MVGYSPLMRRYCCIIGVCFSAVASALAAAALISCGTFMAWQSEARQGAGLGLPFYLVRRWRGGAKLAGSPPLRLGQHPQRRRQVDLLVLQRLRRRVHAARAQGVADLLRSLMVGAALAENVLARVAGVAAVVDPLVAHVVLRY